MASPGRGTEDYDDDWDDWDDSDEGTFTSPPSKKDSDESSETKVERDESAPGILPDGEPSAAPDANSTPIQKGRREPTKTAFERLSSIPSWISSVLSRGFRRILEGPKPTNFREVNKCALLGPSSSGKTSVLAALVQDCRRGMSAEHELRVQDPQDPDDNLGVGSTSDILVKATRSLLAPAGHQSEGLGATQGVSAYQLRVSGWIPYRGFRREWGRFNMKVQLVDAPGEVMFRPSDHDFHAPHQLPRDPELLELLVQHARDAEVLTFCFDVTDRWVRVLSFELEKLLKRIAVEGQLAKCQRVLILLTKVDQLAQKLLDATRHHDLNAKMVAPLIDPTNQAVEALGLANINTIRHYIPAGAKLAVGTCCPWGFKDTGAPMVHETGEANRVTADDNEFMIQWHPYGIRDAIIFMATGIASGTVTDITEEALRVLDRADNPRMQLETLAP